MSRGNGRGGEWYGPLMGGKQIRKELEGMARSSEGGFLKNRSQLTS